MPGAGAAAASGCRSGHGIGWGLEVGELQVYRRDLEWHLVAWAQQRLESGVEGDHLVGPGVEPQVSRERLGCLLLQILDIEFVTFGIRAAIQNVRSLSPLTRPSPIIGSLSARRALMRDCSCCR